MDKKATQAAAQFVSPKKKHTHKQKLRKSKEEGESSGKKTKSSVSILNQTESSSAEPRSEMSIISVDSSKEQKNVSTLKSTT